eukprot:2612562-Pleurochrysis_carterae.AAC.1
MEGSTREGQVCGLLTSFVSYVVFGPWRREFPCLQAAQRDKEAGDGTESSTRGAGERQTPESTAARRACVDAEA